MRKITSFFSVLFLFGILAVSTAAHAAIDTQGAADLKKQIENSLKWRLDMAKTTGKGLKMDGTPEVTPKDSFYEVKLPHVSLVFGPQGRLEVGTVTLKATPQQPGEWALEGKLPAPMTIYDNANAATAHINIGQQQFSATWWPEKQMVSSFISSLQNITVTGVPDKNNKTASAVIDTLKTALALKENSDGTWSGTHMLDTNGIKINISDRKTSEIHIGKILINSAYDHMDVKETLGIQKQIEEAFKADKNMTEEERTALFTSLLLKSQGLIDGTSNSLVLENFSAEEIRPSAEKSATKPPQKVSFNKLSVSNTTTDARQEKSKAHVKASIDGLAISFAPADFAGFIPHTFNMDVNFDNVPTNKILSTLITAQGAKKDPGAKKEVSETPLFIQKMLQDAGASMTIQDTFVTSEYLRSTLSGKVEASPTAAKGAIGKMTLSVSGISETIEKLRGLFSKPNANPQLMGYVSILATLELIGQAEKEADGKTRRLYNFEMTPDGKLLLNGVDFQFIAAGLQQTMRKDKPSPSSAPKARMTPIPSSPKTQ